MSLRAKNPKGSACSTQRPVPREIGSSLRGSQEWKLVESRDLHLFSSVKYPECTDQTWGSISIFLINFG